MFACSVDDYHLDQDSATLSGNPRVGGSFMHAQYAQVSAPPGRQGSPPVLLGESNRDGVFDNCYREARASQR